jgi:ribose transport system ATP-binding protein
MRFSANYGTFAVPEVDRVSAPLLLEMRGIGKSFPGVRALEGVDFDLRAGEVHVLLGENGAGKSTLMKILSGAYRGDSGEVRLDGQVVRLHPPVEARRLGINTIYQECSLVPHLPVYANVFLGRERCLIGGILDRRGMRAATAKILQELGIDLDPDARVSRLSIAQQQMVEIARALAFTARIIVMDEPTSALTRTEIRKLFGLIQAVRERGVGIVYISHRMEEIMEVGDRVTVLRDGRRVASSPVADVDIPQLIRWMADRELEEHFPRRPTSPGEPALEVENLSTKNKLEGITFSLRRGEILGVAGLMGSGRSTLARVLFGELRVRSGCVQVHGRTARIRSPATAVGHRLGYLPEDRKQMGLVLPLSIRQNIALANPEQVYPWGWRRTRREQRLAQTQVDQLRIRTPHLEQLVINLSGGNQQKVVLGKWLAREADILIFDEPTRGIDVASKVDIYELMNRLTERGAAILMISSDLPEILGMSDRILVMRGGRIAAEYQRGAADQESVLRAALGGAA